MSLSALIALVLGLCLTAYAILAGADFGAGILDLTAGRHSSERGALARTIGPLWEANHVWLIFSITILFSVFPTAFAALGTAMLAPLTVALIALVVRGAALSLRADPAGATRSESLLGWAFGAGSVTAPFVFGACAGAVAQISSSGRGAAGATGVAGVAGVPWTGVFAGTVGLLAVALCAHVAACFMSFRSSRAREELAARFRRRGLQTGAAVLALGLLALLAASWKAPALWHRLSTTALPLVVVGTVAAGLSVQALARRRYLVARWASMVAAGAVVWGWFIAQSPRLLGSRLTIHTAAASPAVLSALAIAGAVVLLAVLPAFYLLYALFRRPSLEVTQ